MQTIPLVYIMSPYAHKEERIRRNRYRAVEAYTGRLMVQFPKAMFYSPIVYCHPIAVDFGLPHDLDYWREHDLCIISRSQLGIIFQDDGWDKSVGVDWEFSKCGLLQITVIRDTAEGEHEVVGEALSKLA